MLNFRYGEIGGEPWLGGYSYTMDSSAPPLAWVQTELDMFGQLVFPKASPRDLVIE